jgi:hypothetical protein
MPGNRFSEEMPMSIMPSTPFPPTPAAPSDPQPAAPVSVASSSNLVVNRYLDSYRVAKVLNGLGYTIKIIAMLAGGLVALIGYGTFGAFGVVAGLLLGAIGFVLGILVSAIGQLVKATLDGAVNTSPFLDNNERARIMSL